MNKGELNSKVHIHFVGIGGCGVSAVAQIAHERGYIISGSDLAESIYTQKLNTEQIPIDIGRHERTNLPGDTNLVVRSPAIQEDNPEIIEARKMEIPVITHAQFLGILMEDKYSICVSGSHGKTTTDAVIGLILKEAGLDPTVEVGGLVPEFQGNALTGQSRYLVAEACEFDHSFLYLKPNIAIVLNIESDHPDYYDELKDLKKAFMDFLNLVPDDGYIIANDEAKEVREVLRRTKSKAQIITFGFHTQAEIQITNERLLENGNWQFQLTGMEKRRRSVLATVGSGLALFETVLPGRHNILNATAALIVSDLLGVDVQVVRKVLTTFKGVGRRFEIVDQRYGITVITDYAHHPSQIKATIKAAKKKGFERLIVAFQPHTYSRSKALFHEFSKSFLEADLTFIMDTYVPVGRNEKVIRGYASTDLARKIKKYQKEVIYSGNLEQTKAKLRNHLKMGDGLLLLGAGDIYKIGKEVLERERK